MQPAIDAIEIRHYRLPLVPPFHASWDPRPRDFFNTTLVRVCAGDYEGVGSGDVMLGFEGHEELFIGRDPFEIERHVRLLDNLQFHYGRMWPLEVALWDIMGKIQGRPVWKLLGGDRDRVPVYASTGQKREPDEWQDIFPTILQSGFKAIKMRFHHIDPLLDLAAVRTLRQVVGEEIIILVDANQGWRMPWDDSLPWDLGKAKWVADALDELAVYWMEEPLHRHNYQGLAELRQHARVRIAGGEGNREYADFTQYLHHGSLDIYQPDVVWSTGILRGCQLAKDVQVAGATYSPHTWGDGLVLLANLHVAAAVSNAPFVEYPYDPPTWSPDRRDFILTTPIEPKSDGTITLPKKPGLGVNVDWGEIEPLRIKNPIART